MKNSWGCNWGNAGYFMQSWEFNSQSYFQGIEIDTSTNFVNDVTEVEDPEC